MKTYKILIYYLYFFLNDINKKEKKYISSPVAKEKKNK